MTLADIQKHVGVAADGRWGPNTARAIGTALGMELPKPFDAAAFIARHVNTKANAITDADIDAAAEKLNVSPAHIRMVMKVESSGKSFDNSGRPIILFEPHVFFKRTGGRHGTTDYSYRKWRTKPYPKSYDGRWAQMAMAAAVDEAAALESASWGLFQIMGFHWKALGYLSPQDFAASMIQSEGDQLDALVRFIATNGLAPALRRCTKGKPETCRDFAKGYNGSGYAQNRYHEKMSAAL